MSRKAANHHFNELLGSNACWRAGVVDVKAAYRHTVTYTFTASEAGKHPYYSGTQGDLQIEMGLYGAIIALPATVPSNCVNDTAKTNLYGQIDYGTTNHIPGFPEQDFD